MPLSDSLRSAWSAGTGCPTPEDWLRLETGELAPGERRRLEEHAERCPACASERELARLFAAGPAEGAVPQEDMDYVVAKLEAMKLSETRPPLAFPARRPALAWAVRLAALVVLALGVALFFRSGQAPPLPDRGPGEVYRGSEVRPIGPIGEFRETPREFHWEKVEEAHSYRVILRAVDETVLWDATVASSTLRLPDDVARGLHPAVLYTWSVEALDERGARLAVSEPVRFQIRPAPE